MLPVVIELGPSLLIEAALLLRSNVKSVLRYSSSLSELLSKPCPVAELLIRFYGEDKSRGMSARVIVWLLF
jgi:hypothetical protein